MGRAGAVDSTVAVDQILTDLANDPEGLEIVARLVEVLIERRSPRGSDGVSKIDRGELSGA